MERVLRLIVRGSYVDGELSTRRIVDLGLDRLTRASKGDLRGGSVNS